MRNIEIFHLIVFNVIKEIVTVFPDYASFEIKDILPESECPDEQLRDRYCLNTMDWLIANNYIKTLKGSVVNGWENVVPTEKMLALMSVKLPGMNDKTILTSIGEVVSGAVKGAAQNLVEKVFIAAVELGPNLIGNFCGS